MVVAAPPIAPMNAHEALVLLLQISLLLSLAVVLGQLARRLGMPAVVGELSAGVLLGPSLLAHVAPGLSGWLFPSTPGQMHLLDAVGYFGVLLLVGVTGMSIDTKLLRRRSLAVAQVSAGGLLVPLALGVAVGFMLPASLIAEGADRAVFAWFIGVAMCVSAIPVIAKTLLDMRLLHRNVGQLIISAAAVDDVAGWLLMSMVSAMATTGIRGREATVAVGCLAGVLLFAWLIGRPVVGMMLRLPSRSADPGVVVAVAVLIVMLSAAGTQALGMEGVLGAFFAGILIGSSRWVDRERLAPLRTFVLSVLAPLFFATAGLRMDLTALGDPVVLGAASLMLVVAVAGKLAGGYVGARAGRLGHWDALALGAGLNARGVIQMIIAMVGLRLGVLTMEMYTIIVLVAVGTSLMAPPMLRYAVRRGETLSPEETEREKALDIGPAPDQPVGRWRHETSSPHAAPP
ncbi:cation:proton antiporter [Actinomadura rudentiformis]|uniref:Cation:proton antiporter n=2 Tax=Actinomadura rudentiformis TaxID=359158 RepID=A0A6H9YPC4_9ACTN|nr:cation:proton antiporter [Actinomadura rudentiformis]